MTAEDDHTGKQNEHGDDGAVRLRLIAHGDDNGDGDYSGDDQQINTTGALVQGSCKSINSKTESFKNSNMTNGDDTGKGSVGMIPKGPPWYRSQRYILAYIHFCAMLMVFFQRVNFSIAIVCMVNHTATTTHIEHHQIHSLHLNSNYINNNNNNNISIDNYQYHISGDGVSTIPQNASLDANGLSINSSSNRPTGCDSIFYAKEAAEDGPFVWDKKLQGILLSAIYWSYLVCSMPGLVLVRKCSRKRVTAVSIGVLSISTILLHPAALLSPWAVFVIKLVQGALTPLGLMSVYGMWAAWGPPEERPGLISFCFSGQLLGNSLAFPLSAMLCKYGFLGGWPSVFHVFGFLGLAWVIVFMIFTSDTPATHPWITTEERNYIENSLVKQATRETPRTPWKHVLTSPAVWGIVCAQVSLTWGLFMLLSTLPQYMKEVLKFKIDSNGLYLMLPYLAMYFVALLSGQLSSLMTRRKTMRVAWIRKLTTSFANLIPAILLCVLSFLDCTQSSLAVVLLTMAVGLTGFHYCSFLVNPYDIAPIYAQAVITFSNTIATIPGVVTPYLVAYITKDKTRAQWQTCFLLTAGIQVVGTLAYCILGRGEVQKWAERRERQDILNARTNGEGESTNDDQVTNRTKI